MPENNEKPTTTVRSIRANEEVFERLKEIAAEGKMNNQGEALTALVRMWEMDQAKASIPDRGTEIDNFRATIHKLEDFFLNALEVNINAEDRIRQGFAGQLEANATTINMLQESNKAAMEEIQLLKDRMQGMIDQHNEDVANFTAVKTAKEEQYIEYTNKIADKDRLNEALADKAAADKQRIKELEDELAAGEDYKKTIAELQNKLKATEEANQKLVLQVDQLEQDLQQSNRDHEHALRIKEMEAEHKILAAEKSAQDRISKLQDEFIKRFNERHRE